MMFKFKLVTALVVLVTILSNEAAELLAQWLHCGVPKELVKSEKEDKDVVLCLIPADSNYCNCTGRNIPVHTIFTGILTRSTYLGDAP